MPLIGGGWKFWVLRLTAMGWLAIGQREAALATFSRLLQRWPDSAYGLASRAHVQAQLGRTEQAIADASRLVALHPRRSATDWFNLAYLLEQAQRHAGAEMAFREAVALDPMLDRAWYGLGLVLIRQQRWPEAIEALTRNTELQPMSPYGWYHLARLHVERRQPEDARKIIRHLSAFEPRVAAQLQRETGLVP